MYLFMLVALMYLAPLIAAPAHGMLPPVEGAAEAEEQIAQIEQAIAEQEAAAQPNEAAYQERQQAYLNELRSKAEARNLERLGKARGFKNRLDALAAIRSKKAREGEFLDLLMNFKPSTIRMSYESTPKLLRQFEKDLRQLESLMLEFKLEFGEFPWVIEEMKANRFPPIKWAWEPYLTRIFPPQAAAQPIAPIEIEEAHALKKEKEEKGEKGEKAVEYPFPPVPRRGVFESTEKAPAKHEISQVPQETHLPEYITLISKEGERFPVKSQYAGDPKISAVYAASLENVSLEESHKGIEIPSLLTSELTKLLIRDMQKIFIPQSDQKKPMSEYSEGFRKGMVDNLDVLQRDKVPASPTRLLPKLIMAANQIDSPFLLDLYLRRYVRYLNQLKRDIGPIREQKRLKREEREKKAVQEESVIAQEIRRHNFPLDLIRSIAQMYYLVFDEGIDRDVYPLLQREKDIKGTPAKAGALPKILISIPFDTLEAYDKFPAALLNQFPHLKDRPNAFGSDWSTPIEWVMNHILFIGAAVALIRLPNFKDAFLLAKTVNAPTSVIRAVLDTGADIEMIGNHGRTPIFGALDNANALRLLIEAGANVSVKDTRGMTPLLYAIIQSQPEAVQLLVDAGADVTKKDEAGLTPLQYTVRSGSEDTANNTQIREILLKKIATNPSTQPAH